ncbi:MAG: hypothetical protein QNK32_09615 [Porticoccus sp.]|nr:hypothetical protein [Porticoccus sp.]
MKCEFELQDELAAIVGVAGGETQEEKNSSVWYRRKVLQGAIDLIAELNKSPRSPHCYMPITGQQLIDVGLNAFAVKLLSESIADNHIEEIVSFKYKQVGITIEHLPE